jgi:hypothetical protein
LLSAEQKMQRWREIWFPDVRTELQGRS